MLDHIHIARLADDLMIKVNAIPIKNMSNLNQHDRLFLDTFHICDLIFTPYPNNEQSDVLSLS